MAGWEIEANKASFLTPEKCLGQAFATKAGLLVPLRRPRCARVRRGWDLVRVPARGEQARRNLLEREHAVVVGVDAVELDPEEPPRVAGVLLGAVALLGAMRAGLALREEPGLQDRGGRPHRLLGERAGLESRFLVCCWRSGGRGQWRERPAWGSHDF